MTQIAFLGLGAMGSRMAARLIAAGHPVTVWNRSPQRAAELTNAKQAATPREAVQDAEYVFSMVRDDFACRYVWVDRTAGALTGMAPGTMAIECSTVSVAWSLEWSACMKDRGMRAIDAPVLGSRPQAEAGQLISLAGGSAADVEKASPLLKSFAAAVHHTGPAGTGAAIKLAANTLFATQVAALAELLCVLAKQGVDAAKAVDILATTPIMSMAAKGAAGLMLRNAHAPMFPIELVEKDLRYLLDALTVAGAKAPVSAKVSDVYTAAAEAGAGARNITAIFDQYRPKAHAELSSAGEA